MERGVEGGKSLRKVRRVELEWSESSENKRIFRSLLFSSQLDYFRSGKGDGVKKLFACWKIIINFGEYYLTS